MRVFMVVTAAAVAHVTAALAAVAHGRMLRQAAPVPFPAASGDVWTSSSSLTAAGPGSTAFSLPSCVSLTAVESTDGSFSAVLVFRADTALRAATLRDVTASGGLDSAAWSWNVVTVASDAGDDVVGAYCSAATVPQRSPGVAYSVTSASGTASATSFGRHVLRFARPSCATGDPTQCGSWASFDVDTGTGLPGRYPALGVMDGRPTVAYVAGEEAAPFLRYTVARHSQGATTDWSGPAALSDSGAAGFVLCIAQVRGRPTLLWQHFTQGSLKHSFASGATGELLSAWLTQTVDGTVGSRVRMHASLAVSPHTGMPGAAYTNFAAESLHFIVPRDVVAGDGAGGWASTAVPLERNVLPGAVAAVFCSNWDDRPCVAFHDTVSNQVFLARAAAAPAVVAVPILTGLRYDTDVGGWHVYALSPAGVGAGQLLAGAMFGSRLLGLSYVTDDATVTFHGVTMPDDVPRDEPLSGGAIAGIVLAVLVFVAVAALGAWWLLTRTRRRYLAKVQAAEAAEATRRAAVEEREQFLREVPNAELAEQLDTLSDEYDDLRNAYDTLEADDRLLQQQLAEHRAAMRYHRLHEHAALSLLSHVASRSDTGRAELEAVFRGELARVVLDDGVDMPVTAAWPARAVGQAATAQVPATMQTLDTPGAVWALGVELKVPDLRGVGVDGVTQSVTAPVCASASLEAALPELRQLVTARHGRDDETAGSAAAAAAAAAAAGVQSAALNLHLLVLVERDTGMRPAPTWAHLGCCTVLHSFVLDQPPPWLLTWLHADTKPLSCLVVPRFDGRLPDVPQFAHPRTCRPDVLSLPHPATRRDPAERAWMVAALQLFSGAAHWHALGIKVRPASTDEDVAVDDQGRCMWRCFNRLEFPRDETVVAVCGAGVSGEATFEHPPAPSASSVLSTGTDATAAVMALSPLDAADRDAVKFVAAAVLHASAPLQLPADFEALLRCCAADGVHARPSSAQAWRMVAVLLFGPAEWHAVSSEVEMRTKWFVPLLCHVGCRTLVQHAADAPHLRWAGGVFVPGLPTAGAAATAPVKRVARKGGATGAGAGAGAAAATATSAGGVDAADAQPQYSLWDEALMVFLSDPATTSATVWQDVTLLQRVMDHGTVAEPKPPTPPSTPRTPALDLRDAPAEVRYKNRRRDRLLRRAKLDTPPLKKAPVN